MHDTCILNAETIIMSLFPIKWLSSLVVIAISFSVCAPLFAEVQKISQPISIDKKLAELEASFGGRIGVYAINTANNTHLQYRANERFPMGCTSKVIGVAAILKKSMNDRTLLSQKVTYTKSDLTNWNPITEKHLADGMTVAELCAAAIRYSDNTAMNLLVRILGGVEGMNAFARSIRDHSFRQDHEWPTEAMSGGQGDLHDSSTPSAMANSLKRLALTNTLAKPQRELLLSWLKTNTTGDNRIRAGVPKGWTVGDKTGTGFYYGTTNDIGIIWPPKCAPIVVAIYYTSNDKKAVKREDIVAATIRILINEFAQGDKCIRSGLPI
ncbi:Beta-lactamase Toho-1 precursor [Legionella lansingensis]|uniref:beta-lactamase n=1 Tax=Legionella lansingensis TaxID=45067 RepID=A0A0W0VF14_9GAMM|nr:class A beta-lactamase [Legionella lansingensis]KTD18741.1 Beta-lactamase Toho-1 precursor [Legionella lansingensis]SNV58387.1 Beta-lactamase Toho-1 precursor [Legionella lansingensis]